jgi:hypothetical protein
LDIFGPNTNVNFTILLSNEMNKRKVRIIGAVVLLIAGLFVGGMGMMGRLPGQSGDLNQAPITVPAGAQAGDLIDLHTCTYKAGDTEYAADCGTLIVPENRSNPNSRLIALPVIRVRALHKGYAEPILFLMGGPGISNLKFEFPAGLVDERDFVQVGYRGIDGLCARLPETVAALKQRMTSKQNSLIASLPASPVAQSGCRARVWISRAILFLNAPMISKLLAWR